MQTPYCVQAVVLRNGGGFLYEAVPFAALNVLSVLDQCRGILPTLFLPPFLFFVLVSVKACGKQSRSEEAP